MTQEPILSGEPRLTPRDDARSLLRRLEDHLGPKEEEHFLVLGALGELARREAEKPTEDEAARGPFLASLERGAEIVACAVAAPGGPLLLTPGWGGALPDLVEWLRSSGIGPPGVQGPPSDVDAFLPLWRAATGCEPRRVFRMTGYRLVEPSARAGRPAGVLRRVSAADEALVADWLGRFARETGAPLAHPETLARDLSRDRSQGGGAYLWEDPGPVCLVCLRGETARGTRISIVYTPRPSRGRGHAGAAVDAVCRHLFDRGKRACYLFAEDANRTATELYLRLGFEAISRLTIIQLAT